MIRGVSGASEADPPLTAGAGLSRMCGSEDRGPPADGAGRCTKDP